MRPWLVLGTGAVLASPSAPPGSPMALRGEVIAATSHWTADGSRIVTDATVHTATGDVVVRQLGGSAEGYGMIEMPGPPVLHVGMIVEVAAHGDVDLAGRRHVVLDGARVDFDPEAEGGGPFVRTGVTKAGHDLWWESGCVFLTPDSAGTTELAGSDEFPLIDAAIATWNGDTDVASCSYLRLVANAPRPLETSGRDHVNTIKFRDTSWCRPATKDDPMECHSEWSAGLTTATFVDDGSLRDGAIVDADVEINGVNFAIAENGTTLGTAGCNAELQNTLTHELGHVEGLAHTCLAPGEAPRVDGNGNPVPDCAIAVDPAIIDATMYPFQDCGETTKEQLTMDDIAAACRIYPAADDPGTCAPVAKPGGGCDAGGEPSGALALAAVVLLAASKIRASSCDASAARAATAAASPGRARRGRPGCR